MKSVQEINVLLKKFESIFGYAVEGAEQGSEAWFKCKLGVVSASNASKVVAKRDSETRLTYLCDLIGQICTGQIEEINARAIDWGNQHEAAARSYYELKNRVEITKIPFVFKDDKFRIGCSPDGLVNDRKGLEIKCPFTTGNYIKFLIADDIKPEWRWQYQFTMWVLEAQQWDFSQYDPRMEKKPMKTITIERDETMQKTLDDAIPQFIHDMDKMLAKIGVEFGDQWRRLQASSGAAT